VEHFGEYAHGKRLPSWLLGADQEVREQFLEGYLSGDGYRTAAGNWRAVTVSRALAMGLKSLALSLGYTVGVEFHQTPATTVIEGRTVNQRPWWRVSINSDDGRYTRVEDGLRWSKVRRPVREGR